MIRKVTRTAAAAFPILLVPVVLLAASAQDVLRQAETADKYVSYRGLKTVNVYFGGRHADATLKVLHLKPDKTRAEYFSPILLAGIIVIEDGGSCWKYHPGGRFWEEMPCAQASADVDFGREALANYDVRLLGTDLIAGRSSYVIYAVPKRTDESARRIWVDKEHYLIVATQVETSLGTVVNSSRYTAIDFNPHDVSPSAFKVSGKVVKCAAKPKEIGFRLLKPCYLPKGYKCVGVTGLRINNRICAHTQFTNGANAISLFQRPSDGDSPPVPTNSKITNVYVWTRDGMLFTLMGDIPRAELKKIADSTK
ncbi:MAG: hypothetical protein A2Z18_09905 [Armatimonadetes bacterium RBG_16_58_9]|nr:MAG: hypothetical protein A2Z18_09905 [Armatimonadetes bacterium RBG_16_58_9]